ncbi:unnamed protein product [Aureobasidium pullulans]|nr:unnamed protein product [Aureobasidium pullulans]
MPCAFEERRYVFISHGGNSSTTSSLTSFSETSLSRTSSSIILDEYFWTNYLPQEDPTLDGSIGGILSAPWIPTIRQLANQNSDVRYAIQACALAGLGWMSEDQTLIIRSGAYYAQALKQTNAFMDIWTPGDKMPVLPEWIGPEMPAVYIAQVASHFFKPGMGLWAAHAAVFPVSTALCHFARTGRRDSPAVSAMVDAFATSKTGIIMRDFLEAIGLS